MHQHRRGRACSENIKNFSRNKTSSLPVKMYPSDFQVAQSLFILGSGEPFISRAPSVNQLSAVGNKRAF